MYLFINEFRILVGTQYVFVQLLQVVHGTILWVSFVSVKEY